MITITEIEANRLLMVLESFDYLVRTSVECPYCYAHICTERHTENCMSRIARDLHDEIQDKIGNKESQSQVEKDFRQG